MLVFDSMETGPIMTNTYIVGDSEAGVAAVIDPGGHVGAIMSALDRHKLTCQWIINTHAHFDHVGGNAELKRQTGAPVYIHPAEAPALAQLAMQGRLFGMQVENSPAPDHLVDEGDAIQVGAFKLLVRHTPGHSPGGISLVIEGQERILVGDLVFAGSIGRTDLPGGSLKILLASVKDKLYGYSDATKLYPGHGPATSLGAEKRSNPFLTGEMA